MAGAVGGRGFGDRIGPSTGRKVRFDFFFRDKNNKLVKRDVENSQDTEKLCI